jgi:cysteine desulfurase/selenocysteine lyase
MSTDDQPPHEVRAALGQVIDAGGGFVPLLAPTPVPGAMATASPGVGTAVATPPVAPTLPPGDPQALALVIARMASEMLGLNVDAGSVVPGSATMTPGAPAVPSPGVDATVLPAPFTSPSPSTSTSTSTMTPTTMPATTQVTAPDVPFAIAPASPFAMPLSFDAVPSGDYARMPMFETFEMPAMPGWDLPADLERIDSEVPPTSEPLIRDLGGKGFDPYVVRKDFPILDEVVNGRRLVWLDNAATTQKPQAVIDRLSYYYEHENSNIHRAAHTLAARATDAYEKARDITRRFLNAPSTEEIIFVRGATEGINLVAQSWGRRNITAGDEIVLTHLEHHANIVPWQMLCAEKGARLRIAPVDDRGDVILEEYEKLLGPKTKLVAFTQVSNALGTITPAGEMIAMAHRYGAKVLLDGAQAVSHMHVDVQALDCDFYSFSGHKVFAPTGIGVVYGKREILAAMPPWQGGGNMIQDVTFEKTTYQAPPWRFEAGTGNIADAVGLGEALDYVMRIGMHTIDRYEHDLLVYATDRLATVPGLHMIGTSPNKAGVLSFILDGQKTEEVGGMLDKEGIAVRSGHHCAQPILRRFGLEATVRASLAFYNVCEDIDALVDALRRLQMGRPS